MIDKLIINNINGIFKNCHSGNSNSKRIWFHRWIGNECLRGIYILMYKLFKIILDIKKLGTGIKNISNLHNKNESNMLDVFS